MFYSDLPYQIFEERGKIFGTNFVEGNTYIESARLISEFSSENLRVLTAIFKTIVKIKEFQLPKFGI